MSDCLHLESAEYVGCLTPITPHIQGPDPDDTPEPCGNCPLCIVIIDRDYLRVRVATLEDGMKRIALLGADSTGTVGASCHWHHEAAEIARTLLDVSHDQEG